jgi:hypothetical protein
VFMPSTLGRDVTGSHPGGHVGCMAENRQP